VKLLEQAQRLNPHHTEDHPRTLGGAYFFAHRYQDAIAVLNRITSRPSSAYWLYKAATHAELGQLDQAHAAIAEALEIDPELTLQGEHERRLALGLAPAYAEHLTAALRKAGLAEKAATPDVGRTGEPRKSAGERARRPVVDVRSRIPAARAGASTQEKGADPFIGWR